MLKFARIGSLVCVVAACDRSVPLRASIPIGEGRAQVPGGSVWYEVVGNGSGIPLLLIHGGPGASSCAFESLRALGADRPVILYDQLGAGLSDRPADTTLWRLPRFLDEVDALRRHLRLDTLHVLGHSWGGTIATEYALTRGDSTIRSLILAAPLVSTPRWITDAKTLVAQLPAPLRATIDKHERAGTTTNAAYLAAADSFYARFLFRSGYPPSPTAACAARPFNDIVYRHMWGPTEFTANGTLATFDRLADLARLPRPLLWIAGQYDEVPVPTLEEYQRVTPGSRIAVIPDAAHMAMVDQPAAYVQAIRAFLAEVEAGR